MHICVYILYICVYYVNMYILIHFKSKKAFLFKLKLAQAKLKVATTSS